MKKVLISISIIFLFGIFIYIIKTYVSIPSGVQLKIDEIATGYEGTISEKFSVRNTKPTHLKIKTVTGFIEISPYQKIVDSAQIGDSLIKPEYQNFVYLKKGNGQVHKIFYTKLSLETRNHKSFPKEWKEKWMESSEWDQ
ncbi:hypothetical protein ZORO111903_07530 [Zobellia roscoffensis]|uniref:hypothetical protein n=1 Tax=Zobellia roscoffensis TaxID=2779508 RepID=UPI001889E305|nr:hypothetical protein [Zobellia roscoffensis]